jgi:8-oxo-dGTP pyrophosphatase MutT (NUDIX family)
MPDQKKTPPPLRKASTVILARENNNALEIYLLRRSTKSGFMGGLYVFPGGVADPEDFGIDAWAPYIDMEQDQIEKQLGGHSISKEDIMGFSIAAIRETLEEAGVFIASGKNKTKKDIQDICAHRLNKDLPKSWFKTKIMSEDWTLSFSSLGKWSHWVTPKLMKKRFDTRFFIVFMPEDQACVPDNMETKHGIWMTPENALEQNLNAKVPMSPPTVVTMTQLLKFNTFHELKRDIQTRVWGDPIAPHLVVSPKGPVIIEPWDPMYDTGETIDTSNLSKKVLPPCSQFSRIWCDKDVWKPVGI